MTFVNPAEITDLRRDEAIALALTRAAGQPQTIRSVLGRLSIAAWESLQRCAADPDGAVGGSVSRAVGLAPHDIVGDRAEDVAGLLEQLVPLLCRGAGHHAQHWRATRTGLGLPASHRDRVLTRFGSSLGRVLLTQESAGTIGAAYREAASAAREPAGPSAAEKRAVGTGFEDRPDLRELWQQALAFSEGLGRFHSLLTERVGVHSRDFPRCRCRAHSITESLSCQRHEAVSAAVVGFLDKVQRQLAALSLAAQPWQGDDVQSWFWSLARFAMRDAVARIRRPREVPLDDEADEAPQSSADEVFHQFRQAAVEHLEPGHRQAEAWFRGHRVISLLSQWDGSPRRRTPEGVRRAVRRQFLADMAAGRPGLERDADAAAEAFLRALGHDPDQQRRGA